MDVKLEISDPVIIAQGLRYKDVGWGVVRVTPEELSTPASGENRKTLLCRKISVIE